MKKYKAILFDMDGVIVDSMSWHAQSWQRVFHEYGIELTKHEIFKREGMSGLSSIIDIIKEKGLPAPHKNELQLLLEKKLQIFETSHVSVFPLIDEIIKYIISKNKKIGLVTGSLRRSVRHVLPENIMKYFDVIVTVDDIHNGKPHPEPYQKAMGNLGCRSEETLVIENAPLGIASAKEAGAYCLAIETTLEASFLKEADSVVKNHKALLDSLKELI